MKNSTKAIIVLFLICIIPFNAVTAFASEAEISNGLSVTPRLANLAYSTFDFVATSSEGTATIIYAGSGSFSHISVHVKVEKRFLLAFWNDVDEWSTTSTSSTATLSHVFALDGNGTYRATLTLEVTGTNGTVETATDTITYKTN